MFQNTLMKDEKGDRRGRGAGGGGEQISRLTTKCIVGNNSNDFYSSIFLDFFASFDLISLVIMTHDLLLFISYVDRIYLSKHHRIVLYLEIIAKN